MIDRSLKHAGIFAKQVELPFVDQNLIYAKQEVQRVYGFGIVKVMNLINSYQKDITTRSRSCIYKQNA